MAVVQLKIIKGENKMTIYDMAKQNYLRGTWTLEMLQALVAKGKLSQAQYEDITGAKEVI